MLSTLELMTDLVNAEEFNFLEGKLMATSNISLVLRLVIHSSP